MRPGQKYDTPCTVRSDAEICAESSQRDGLFQLKAEPLKSDHGSYNIIYQPFNTMAWLLEQALGINSVYEY